MKGAPEQDCLEQKAKPVEAANTLKAAAGPEVKTQQQTDRLKLKALRAVIDTGALSVSLRSMQQMRSRLKANKTPLQQRGYRQDKRSRDENMKFLQSQVQGCYLQTLLA